MQTYTRRYRFCYLVNSQMLLETDYTALVAHDAGKQLYGEGEERFLQLRVALCAGTAPAEGVACT